MSEPTPCIVCGAELASVDIACDNQPYEGTNFRAYGQYGSTVFDPMDGSFLEVIICDDCLKERAAQVMWGRESKPVVARTHPTEKIPTIVGTTRAHRELTPWNPELDYDETLELDTEEIGNFPDVKWAPWVAEWVASRSGAAS